MTKIRHVYMVRSGWFLHARFLCALEKVELVDFVGATEICQRQNGN